jgi:hypothetical protein
MDPEIITALAKYLNGQIGMETCDSSLSHSEEWLEHQGVPDPQGVLDWLRDQGVTCDCEVVTLVYLRLKEEGPKTLSQ